MKKLLVALIILLTVAPVFALNTVELGAKYYANPASSRALFNADIYVGEPDLDPEVVANQKTLSVLQENGNVVAVAQPISTGSGGVPLYNGSYVTLLVEGDYSIKVLDSVGSQIYYVPNTSASATGATFEDWVISTTYGKNSFVVGSDDRLYYSLAGGNIGNDPTSTLGFWQISSNFEGFGSNSRHEEYQGDLDDLLNNSIYNIEAGSVTNEPAGMTSWGFIHTYMHRATPDFAVQMLYNMDGTTEGRIWTRRLKTAVWSSWVLVYTETTLPATTEVQADNSVVVLDGGTDGTDAVFTGDVTGNADTSDVATKIGVLNVKEIDIGDWDMDATTNVFVAHGLTNANIRTVTAMIRNDAATIEYPSGSSSDVTSGVPDFWVSNSSGVSNTVELQRLTSGAFDGTDFDSTSYNRGWITIWYID